MPLGTKPWDAFYGGGNVLAFSLAFLFALMAAIVVVSSKMSPFSNRRKL
jgi:hypothetical protein